MEVLEDVNGSLWGTKPTEQTVSLRRVLSAKLISYGHWKRSIPHADKFYLNIHRESFLECGALIPPSLILASVHLVCEGNLLVVPSREQPHL